MCDTVSQGGKNVQESQTCNSRKRSNYSRLLARQSRQSPPIQLILNGNQISFGVDLDDEFVSKIECMIF